MERVPGDGERGRNFTWVLSEAASVTCVNATTADAAQVGGEAFQTVVVQQIVDHLPTPRRTFRRFLRVLSLLKVLVSF